MSKPSRKPIMEDVNMEVMMIPTPAVKERQGQDREEALEAQVARKHVG